MLSWHDTSSKMAKMLTSFSDDGKYVGANVKMVFEEVPNVTVANS
jgi:hypothetical protein